MTKEPPISSLLPCPFCGKEPSMWSRDMILPWVIQCCASMVSSDKKMLIESWNTRAHSTPDPERGDGPSIPSEAERAKRWRSLTDHLPALPPNTETSWLWSDKDIEMLRAACFRRFGESLRTESLFCIAATGIRIYLSQLQTTPDREGLVERVADEVIAKHGQLLTDLFQEVPSEFIADDRAGVARGFLRAMTKTAIAIVRQHQAGQQNGSASSCDEETLGASTAEIAGESPAAPSTTENKVVMPHTLLSAFHKYGRHTRECEAEFAKQFPRPKCICGYDDVLADLIEFQHDASGYSGESPVKSGSIPTNYDSVEGTAPTDRSGHVGNAVANHARGEIRGVINDAEAVKILCTGYIDDQFESQHNNIGCCIASMEAAWQALKPHLRKPEPVRVKIPLSDEAFVLEHIWRLFDPFQSPTIGNRSPRAEESAKIMAKRVFDKLAPYLRTTEPDHDRVNIPVHEDEAAMMVLLGTQWLEKNAPHRLRKPVSLADCAMALQGNERIKLGSDLQVIAKSVLDAAGVPYVD